MRLSELSAVPEPGSSFYNESIKQDKPDGQCHVYDPQNPSVTRVVTRSQPNGASPWTITDNV